MVFVLELENFQGPFNVLLELLDKRRLDITDVSLAEVTAEYLDYMSKIDLSIEDMGWFLFVAAKLALDKSQLVLRITPEQDETEINITESLKSYQQIKSLALDLSVRSKKPLYSSIGRAPKHNRTLLVSRTELDAIFKSLMNYYQKLPKTKNIKSGKLSIESFKRQFYDHISKMQEFSAQDILAKSSTRAEAIVYFLTLLELLKQGRISNSNQKFLLEVV